MADTKNSSKHISIKFINVSFIVIVLVFSLGIDILNSVIYKKYNYAVKAQQTFIVCNNAANMFKHESDELTFCVTGYLSEQSDNTLGEYYSIIDNKLREKEIEKAKKFNIDCSSLEEALKISDELSKYETHAFKLIVSANNALSSAPRQVKEYVLPENEENLSKEEKISLAKELIYSNEYNSFKRDIYDKTEEFEYKTLHEAENRVLDETDSISLYLKHQYLFQGIENILVFLAAIMLYKKVTVVLEKYIKSISQNRTLSPEGTSELVYLAQVLNEYTESKNKEHENLKHRAENDSLTNAANRSALENFISNKLNSENSAGALVFLDVDEFKTINDTYGHDAGDAVLKFLVTELQNNFRENDFVGRFGGDEFIVWLDNVTLENIDLVKSRLHNLNEKSMLIGGRKINLSISAGITFCKSGDKFEDVLKRADTALYQKKKSGKKGCFVYEEL